MRAFICDACGKQYKPYAFTKKNGEGNCMTIVKVEKDGVIYPKARLELCQTCMDDLWDYLKIDLIRPESPLYNRFHKETASEDTNEEDLVENVEDVSEE